MARNASEAIRRRSIVPPSRCRPSGRRPLHSKRTGDPATGEARAIFMPVVCKIVPSLRTPTAKCLTSVIPVAIAGLEVKCRVPPASKRRGFAKRETA